MTYKREYTGKIVYMGIDVHKKTYACVSVCEGEVVKRDTMPAKPEALLHYMQRFFAGAEIKSAYEAGFSGFHLHRYLVDNGIDNRCATRRLLASGWKCHLKSADPAH